jgi:hypothetical protein
VVNAFPLPLSVATSIFEDELDDDSQEIRFSLGFTFAFYGVVHNSLHLNTNGGITFRADNDSFEPTVAGTPQPTVAPFWGDHQVEGAPGRANQLSFQQCADRFVVVYQQFQQFQSSGTAVENNSATVTLRPDGTIVMDYGTVLSSEIMAGVFDGTHTDDRRPNPGGANAVVQAVYNNYSTLGTGTILADSFGAGPSHDGELSGRTVTFSP